MNSKVSKSNSLPAPMFLDVVNNQLKDNNPPETKQTLNRLIAEGHTAEEAKILIAKVVAVEMVAVMKAQAPFNRDRFVKNLQRLPQDPKE